MAKVNEAINGGAPEPGPSSSGKANPKLQLVARQSTLRLLDSYVVCLFVCLFGCYLIAYRKTADSVRNAMVDRDSESDIDDTDSENEVNKNTNKIVFTLSFSLLERTQ